MRRTIFCVIGAVVAVAALLGAAIAFGTAAPPPAVSPRHLDLRGLPPIARYTARESTNLAYRAYPGGNAQVAVVLHGTGTESRVMNAVARSLHASGATVYALDLRGSGQSGRRGDIDYIGQLDDDIADFVATVRPERPRARFTLIGFSGGAALAMEIAGGQYGNLFDRYIVVSPAIPYPSPIARPNGGWVALSLPRIVGLVVLNKLGIHWFDGLPTIAFAIPENEPNFTSRYSFRLMMNLANFDYLAGLARTKKPMTLLAGSNDEQFCADRYAAVLQPPKPDLVVEIVPGLDHRDMILKPAGIAAIQRAFDGQTR